MRERSVEFFSHGEPISGILRTPDTEGRYPAIVQGPGWLGLKDAALYVPYHRALTDAGFAVLIFDYRGFGDSGGDRRSLSPRCQLDDLINAVTYLETRDDVDAGRLGVFGSGGTGGGNAVMLAAVDSRLRASVAQVPVSDGEDWLRRMRPSAAAWNGFVERLDTNRRQLVLTGRGEMVNPREDIMIPSSERRTTKVKADVDGRVPTSVPLASADEIIAYRPLDHAGGVSGLLVIAVAEDDVTPTDHAEALYAAAAQPKKLVMQYNTTHYAAYQQYGEAVRPLIVDWFRKMLGDSRPVEGDERVEIGL